MTFRKTVLFSMLTVLLGFTLVYGLSLEFKSRNSAQDGHISTVPLPGMMLRVESYVPVFAYDAENKLSGGSGFVQASVTINGTEFNGTTSVDVQNPLIFMLRPGEYSVFGTYGLATKNVTINVTLGGVYDAFLNFGSYPPPPLGHIVLEAWYTTKGSDAYESCQIEASVAITGPEQHNGTTRLSNDLIFTVQPGEYSVYVTYGSATQTDTLSVTANHVSGRYFFFGVAGAPPPP